MSQDNHENINENPTTPELPPTEAPAPITPLDALLEAAKAYTAQLDSDEKNAPLERGLCLKFQKAWNKAHRDKRDQLALSGTIDRATVKALRKLHG